MSEISVGTTRREWLRRALGAGLVVGIGAGALGACSKPEPIPFQITGAVEAPDCAKVPAPTYKLSIDKLVDGLMKERNRGLQAAICLVAYNSASKAIDTYQDNSAEVRLIRSSSADPSNPHAYLVHLASREGPKSVDMKFATLPAGDQPDLTKLESIMFSSPHLDEEQRPELGKQDRVTLTHNAAMDSWHLNYQTVDLSRGSGELTPVLSEFDYYPFAYGFTLGAFEERAQQVAEILATKTDIPN
jgi:hypothetical protein